MDDSDSNGGAPGGYDAETDGYRVDYDPQSPEPVTTVVVRAVAALTDSRPTELEPLYDAVDPDALNRLYRPESGRRGGPDDGRATFTYGGCRVQVFAAGAVEVDPDPDS